MICIIQARMSSKRLRGKVLMNIDKIPMLMQVYNQVKKSNKIKEIIIATSMMDSDKPIINLCKKNNIKFYCGSLDDVYERFCGVLRIHNCEGFVRICADSPIIDSKLITDSIEIFNAKKCGIVTNIFPRSFPKGLSVEVINKKLFLKSKKLILKKEHKEHITSYFYENRKNIKIHNIINKNDYSNINLSIDTKSDLNFIRKLYRDNQNIKKIYKSLLINIKYN